MIEPPEKKAALGSNRAPKTNELSLNTPITLWCKWCNADRFCVVERLTGEHHYAKARCGSCGRCLKFLEKPATTEHRRFNAYRIAKLLSMPDLLDAWERGFITSIATQKKLSPKQQAKLDELAAACGIRGAR